jgi:hypothetical protein
MVILGGCASIDMDRSADFSRYKTFGWGKATVKMDNPVFSNSSISNDIKALVRKEFAKRGITFRAKNADLLVSYQAYVEKKQRSYGGTPFYYYPNYYYPYPIYPLRFYSFGWYPFGFGLPYGWSDPLQNDPYTEGTLIIQVADNKTGEIIWKGSVTGIMDDVKVVHRRIEKGVRAIMKKYPVPALQPEINRKEVIS